MTESLESWDDLRQFLAVARHGSLKSAATALGVNHSTVFRHIALLEEKLGVRLFHRHSRGYRLTAAGEEMMATARSIEDEITSLDRRIVGTDQKLCGDVRVATAAELIPILGRSIKRFHETHPEISTKMNTDWRFVSLTNREADVAIRLTRGPVEPCVQAQSLCEISLAAYATPAYLRGRGWPEAPEELRCHELISSDKPCTNVEADRWIENTGLSENVVYRDDSTLGQLHAAVAGLGVAVLPTFVGDRESALERLFDVTAGTPRSLWLLVHEDLLSTARVRAFADFMLPSLLAERDLFEGRRPARRDTTPPPANDSATECPRVTSKTLVANSSS